MTTDSAPEIINKSYTSRDITELVNTKQYKLAERVLIKYLEVSPDNPWALTALGIVYRSTDRAEAAEACYRRALLLQPDNPEVCSNYGNLLVDLNRLEEALEYSQRAVTLAPDVYTFRKNLAVTQRECKHYEDSVENYEWCLEHNKNDPNLMYDTAYVLFYLRDLKRAWDLAEWRVKTGKLALPDTKEIPVWTGEKLKGKKLLVYAEQGFGDTLLMTRFLPGLAKLAEEVTFSCKEPLHNLFKDLPVRLVPVDIRDHDRYDYQIAMMSIPRVVKKLDWAKDWPQAPKLHISDTARKRYSNIKTQFQPRLKIGIVWSGSVTFANNDKRSVSLQRFLDLAGQFPDVQFYSFQKGPREKDLLEHGIATVIPLGHTFRDFSDTAAALEEMDLILMTDSALVHLSGLLHVPVIDLLQFMPYWLYFPEEPTTPLYESVRFIRQPKAGDWDFVFKKAANIISRLHKQRKKGALSRAEILKIIDTGL